MVRQIRAGILDLIGAARPSIADPFLPKKIEEGRLIEIRECIGCNICVSGDFTMSPIRCTQNSSMGEEFRRGWHPERSRAKESDSTILVVGAGPAGLEAARVLGLRGYQVALAEGSRELGGRVARECKLPGLSAWGRVLDYRQQAISTMSNVEVFMESPFEAEDVIEFGFDHVAVATGSSWRRDGVARWHTHPIEIAEQADVLTPDDLIAGRRPSGKRVVIFDDDHYYMAGVLAEMLAGEGFDTCVVTPASQVSPWTVNTMEVIKIQRRLIEKGLELRVNTTINAITPSSVVTECAYTGAAGELAADSVVLVTARLPEDALYVELAQAQADGRLSSVRGIGDAWAPGTIANAVWSGRRYAEEFDATLPPNDVVQFRREVTELARGR
jgi:dimethylamine/trimethylamine dehydrogenase